MSTEYNEYFDHLYKLLKEAKTKDTILKFFVVYSRFEYALKKSRFLKNEKEGKNAEADWYKFADKDDYPATFEQWLKEPNRLTDAVKYLEKCPPKKEIVSEDQEVGLEDEATFPPKFSRLKKIIKSIQTVRNNLFHGEKIQDLFPDHERDAQLLDSSLVILGELLKLDSNVEKYFTKGMDN